MLQLFENLANMVLDIDEFRPEKGGNPDKIKENQKRRFASVEMVDKIVQADELWRKGKFEAEEKNAKNFVTFHSSSPTRCGSVEQVEKPG